MLRLLQQDQGSIAEVTVVQKSNQGEWKKRAVYPCLRGAVGHGFFLDFSFLPDWQIEINLWAGGDYFLFSRKESDKSFWRKENDNYPLIV